MSMSPFGLAADRARQEQEAITVQEALRLMEELKDSSLRLVDRYRRKAEEEQAKRTEAEARLRRYVDQIDSRKIGLEAEWESVLAEIRQGVDAAHEQPEVRALQARLADAESEAAVVRGLLVEAERERDAAIRMRDVLEVRLRAHQEPGAAGAPAVRDLLNAESMRGVLEQALQHCTLLTITADIADVDELEHHTKSQQWRARLGDTLAAMQSYAEAKLLATAQGKPAGSDLASFQAYCASRDNPLISPDKIKLSDSQTARTAPRARSQRTLPVPDHVDPSGRMLMVAHVRIGDGQPPAPRLYFHDATGTPSSTVVIGYVGDHLVNASTN
ncbi:hypothetical protein AB0M29_11110 [Streptomyces sp. NPDC051976]|uniref:hypothetical protein n=1 Tax=Streptomyces sp. NPDC051976 TaxID=3154947 RepID=UPI003438AF99